jgi:hypothetical protein
MSHALAARLSSADQLSDADRAAILQLAGAAPAPFQPQAGGAPP